MDDHTVSRKTKMPRKAYFNIDFLKSKDARILRILSEYLEPASRLKWKRVEDTIVFFGSARASSREDAEKRLALALERMKAGTGPAVELRRELELAEKQKMLSRY